MNLVVKMLITLSLIGILSGGVLSKISDWAKPHIAHHRMEATKAAIFEVQPEAKDYKKLEYKDVEAYEVLDSKSNNIGYALAYEGSGFQGKIRLMVGLDKDLNQITGLQILEQVETPGLGTKVTEKPYLNQFIGLNTKPKVDWFKGEKSNKKDNEIQAITGATISSKAVVFIINDGLEKLRAKKAGGEL